MSKKKEFNHLDWNLCRNLYNNKKLYDSLFDPTKILNLKTNSKFYASNLSELECFVDKLLSNDETPFVPYLGSGGKDDYHPTSLAGTYFKRVPHFIVVVNMLSPLYDYSERVNAFITCCHSMGLQSERLDWGKTQFNPKEIDSRFNGVSAAEIFNALVKNIRSEWKIKKSQAKVNDINNVVSMRYDAYCKYVDSLFDDCARLAVLRIDLFYKKQYSNSVNISDMQKDLGRFFKYQRHNSLFDYKKGYIAKLEYGIDKGFHWYFLYFFDGSERKNSSHVHLAEEIGEYWISTITKGRGDYAFVDNNADNEGSGIEVTNRNDVDLRKYLKERVIHYLCKVDQFIKLKSDPNVKHIRRGLPLKRSIKKLGRPVKEVKSLTEHDQFCDK